MELDRGNHILDRYFREVTPADSERMLITKIIELDKQKKALKSQHNFAMSEKREEALANCYREFETLLKQYLKTYSTGNILAVTVRPHEENYPNYMHSSNSPMDPRFSYYQFVKFKFKRVDYVCAILPFIWFTQFFSFNPVDRFMPEMNDQLTLQILKLKEQEGENYATTHIQTI